MGYEDSTEGWQGNWAAGERPKGYVSTTARYLSLKTNFGFSTTRILGADFVKKYNEIIDKAKLGRLSPSELETLMEQNRAFLKAMNDFEASQNAKN